MDIREYLQKEQKGFYAIIEKMLTVERRKQLYDVINDWHESELKLLGITNVVGRSEQLVAFLKWVGDGYDFENNAEKIVKEYIDEGN